MNRIAVCATLGLLAAAVSCSHETVRDESTIGFDVPESRLLGLLRVVQGDRTVGWVQTWAFADHDPDPANDRKHHIVLDPERRRLGFVTDSGTIWRYRAHFEPEMVGASDLLDRGVRTLLDVREGDIRLVDEVRSAGQPPAPVMAPDSGAPAAESP